MKSINDIKVLVRGAGDIASGIIWSLHYVGFKVICIEIENPSCIRTEVSFSDAIYNGIKTLDGITCIRALCCEDAINILDKKNVPILIDKDANVLSYIQFDVLVDAIMAKKNIGTNINMANIVIGVGPGFTANVDCHYAIETMRGHKLGFVYETGSPLPNTGIPGVIAEHSFDRVMHSPCDGIFHNIHKIGDKVFNGETLSNIEEYKDGIATGRVVELHASIDGLLRGILRDGYHATCGLKCADIDPRLTEYDNCFSISDKSRAIGNSVLSAVMHGLFDKGVI